MISLVMATVGRTEEIRRLIDSLIAQTERRFELIAVDQNNDDRLVPILEDAASRGLHVKHLRLDKPNLSLARNRGISAAAYDIVCFPDDDCWYDPHCLEQVLNTFAADSNLDACVALWEERDGDCAQLPAHLLQWQVVSSFRSVPISSITLFIQRDGIRAVGGFDARLGVGRWFGSAEETDLVMSLVRQGRKVKFAPEATVHHAVGTAKPALHPGYWQALRRRARGTGAVYAKHRLRSGVILRGLLSPIAKALIGRQAGLRAGFAVSLGRLEGYLRWQISESRGGNYN